MYKKDKNLHNYTKKIKYQLTKTYSLFYLKHCRNKFKKIENFFFENAIYLKRIKGNNGFASICNFKIKYNDIVINLKIVVRYNIV